MPSPKGMATAFVSYFLVPEVPECWSLNLITKLSVSASSQLPLECGVQALYLPCIFIFFITIFVYNGTHAQRCLTTSHMSSPFNISQSVCKGIWTLKHGTCKVGLYWVELIYVQRQCCSSSCDLACRIADAMLHVFMFGYIVAKGSEPIFESRMPLRIW